MRPTGSSSFMTSSTPEAIPDILSEVSLSLSCIAADIPFFSAASRSALLAERIFSVFSVRADLIAARALFFCSVEAQRRVFSQAFALAPSVSA